MRHTPSRVPSRDPRPTHSLATTAAGALAAALAIVLLTLAVLHPVAATAAVGLALATWPLVRGYRRLYRARIREGRTRRVCLPETDACVEV